MTREPSATQAFATRPPTGAAIDWIRSKGSKAETFPAAATFCCQGTKTSASAVAIANASSMRVSKRSAFGELASCRAYGSRGVLCVARFMSTSPERR